MSERCSVAVVDGVMNGGGCLEGRQNDANLPTLDQEINEN